MNKIVLAVVSDKFESFVKGVKAILPNGDVVMPVKAGWTDGTYKVVAVLPALPVPKGKQVVSTTVEKDALSIWRFVNELEDIPAPERSQMPKLSLVDFRRKLRTLKVVERTYLDDDQVELSYLDGIYEDDILGVIAQISDKELAAEARDYFLYAQYIERINPWVDILGNMFGLTAEQIDDAWISE